MLDLSCLYPLSSDSAPPSDGPEVSRGDSKQSQIVSSTGAIEVSSPLSVQLQHDNDRKARYRRRLLDRWSCSAAGHRHCFANRSGVHVPLSDENIEAWVCALDKGEATLLTPPDTIVPQTIINDQSDRASIASSTSRNTIEYQRPFRLQASPSLTDLRSMQVRLSSSISSSCSEFTLSSTSSGVPGIGHLSGKGIKWLGLQILRGVGVIEIARRRWVITRLVSEMGKLDANGWENWLLAKEQKVRRAAEDLLELSSEHYNSRYQLQAIKQGSYLRGIISNSPVSGTPASAAQDSFVFRLFPLYLLSVSDSAPSTNFAHDIREIFLQDTEYDAEGLLNCEFVAQLCNELAYGLPSEWRYLGYATLWRLVRTSFGNQLLEDLDRRGDLIKNLANNAFDNPIGDTVEQATAVKFFAIYAEHIPTFRDQVLLPTGVPLLIQNIKQLSTDADEWTIERLCSALFESSQFQWCSSTLIELDICPSLVKILIDQLANATLLNAWTVYSNVLTIRNIALLGGDSGLKAVHNVVTDQLRKALPESKGHVRTHLGSAMADTFQDCILTITSGA